MIHSEELADGVWLFRYIPTGKWGDDYTFICTGQRKDDETIILKGFMGEFSRDVWDAMFVALNDLNFKLFTSWREGEWVTKRVIPRK